METKPFHYTDKDGQAQIAEIPVNLAHYVRGVEYYAALYHTKTKPLQDEIDQIKANREREKELIDELADNHSSSADVIEMLQEMVE